MLEEEEVVEVLVVVVVEEEEVGVQLKVVESGIVLLK